MARTKGWKKTKDIKNFKEYKSSNYTISIWYNLNEE